VVKLEDFLTGNSDYGSIGCNLTNHPGHKSSSRFLLKFEKTTVRDVLVEVNEVADGSQTWPFSGRVYVLSSAGVEDIRLWLRPLLPDQVTEGWANNPPPAAPLLQPGVRVFAAWWD
jgi:hypothetical protein